MLMMMVKSLILDLPGRRSQKAKSMNERRRLKPQEWTT
jgi:hypothetical protein